MTDIVDVVIVGAGLAGLACADDLTKAGLECRVLEGSDGVGGRVRTDAVDGYLLDRGFQILLTAYPEVQCRLDLEALGSGSSIPVRWSGSAGGSIASPTPCVGLNGSSTR